MTTTAPAGLANYPRENIRRMISEYRAGDRLPAGYLATAFRFRAAPKITPANVRAGLGATDILWTDSHACEIVEVSPTGKVVTVRPMRAERDPSWKPDFHRGGFVGHVSNQESQRWFITSNPEARTFRATWSEKAKCWKHGGCRVLVHAEGHGHEFYDYNF